MSTTFDVGMLLVLCFTLTLRAVKIGFTHFNPDSRIRPKYLPHSNKINSSPSPTFLHHIHGAHRLKKLQNRPTQHERLEGQQGLKELSDSFSHSFSVSEAFSGSII